MNNKFYTANGKLSAYAFACGYIQKNNGWSLFKDGCWHVRRSNTEWLTFSTLTEARRKFWQLSKDN